MKPTTILLLALALTFGACRTVHHLADGEVLYTGAKIRFENEHHLEDEKEIRIRLREYLRPEPNQKLFGMARFKLWVFQHTREPKKEKSLRRWLKYRIGEPPVFIDQVNVLYTAEQLEAEMFNEGYFQTQVSHETTEHKQKARVTYTVQVGTRYHLDTVIYPPVDSSVFGRHIDSLSQQSVLRTPNAPYSLSLLQEEKERLEFGMKERGFYYFNQRQVYFRADTTIGHHRVKLRLEFDESMPEKSRTRYTLGEVRFNPFYGKGQEQPGDTLRSKSGVVFVGGDSLFRPNEMDNHIYTKPGDTYSKSAHEMTGKQLSTLGVFDFVNVIVQESDTGSRTLDVYIQTTPSKRRTFGSNLNLITKSNGFTGPNLEVSWINRNLFRGAEYFESRIDGGFEAQLLTKGDPLFSYEWGINNELRYPKMISAIRFPMKAITREKPQTRFLLGYRMLNRVNLYRMHTANASYGYRWRRGPSIQHELDIISLTYMQVGNVTDSFRQRLDENPGLRRSFEQQFIIDKGYTFTYTPPVDDTKWIRPYVKAGVELSGNLLHWGMLIIHKDPPTDADPYTILGLPFAQYVKTDVDLRAYVNIGPQQVLVFRQFTGVGIPYGNSSTMPFVKQYFSGGASSIRAFRFRSIGPGTYQAVEDGTYHYLDQSGDIKLESNIEYRFPIQKALRGAVFTDAGNVWLFNDSPEKPGGRFQRSEFMSEMAVGVGAGLRLDLNFFVLRFDTAMPVRKPFLPKAQRWVLDQIDFGSPSWRGDNLIFNLAIGYPF